MKNFYLAIAALVLMASPLSAQSAVLDVQSLFVDNVSVDISVNTVTQGASSAIVPPAEITMGQYQASILDISTALSGSATLDATIYSTDSFGMPAPSASVDTSLGIFSDIDLSSLRVSGMITDSSTLMTTYSFDTSLWPITTTPTLTSYNSTTGDFSLTWAISEMIMYDITALGSTFTDSLSTDMSLTLSGNATVVPVPAALWLFISGLLAINGLIRSRK